MPKLTAKFLTCKRPGGKGWSRKCAAVLLCMASLGACAQSHEVTLHVNLGPGSARRRALNSSPPSVAWLVPMGGDPAPTTASAPHTYRMVQKNKQFIPHLMVVPVGSLVEFPNEDPFFHNVFSLYNGKRFDLGLYETGSAREVRFDREGVSYIFCNIHPEMGAVILALSTPYFAVSHDGDIAIPHVPPGRYMLNVWTESATAASLSAARKQVTVADDGASLGAIDLVAAPSPAARHANKFGESYPSAATGDSPASPY
jgi:plastocyanin